VNVFLDADRLVREATKRILEAGERFGHFPERREKVLLEHTSANPNGPLHVGRARNPILGDTLARLLKAAGYQVEVQFYLDDMGKQVALLAWGTKNLDEATLPPPQKDKVDHRRVRFYQKAVELEESDPRVKEAVQDLVRRSEEGDVEVLRAFEDAYKPVLDGMFESLRALDITYDRVVKESSFVMNGDVAKVMERLEKQTKVPVKDEEGAKFLDLEGYGIHGKTARFVFRRRDGTSLYPTRDVAYHLWKGSQADRLINVLGEDHKLQSTQVRICLEALGAKVLPEVVFYSFVALPEGKMSTRRNRVVFLDDLMDEAIERALDEVTKRRPELDDDARRRIARLVGHGALRYNIASVQAEKPITFRWEDALNFEGDSAPFIQYAHARAASILRKCAEPGTKREAHANRAPHASEIALLKELARMPRVVEDAARTLRVHLAAGYAHDVAARFSAFYRDCPVLSPETRSVDSGRLRVVEAARITLRNALTLLGIAAPDSM
jgi:arginyl-tRNA synthetase